MKLSQIAWQKSLHVIDAIKKHPFNVELASGSLDILKFSYYIEQDSLYLQDFAKSFGIIAARAPSKFTRDLLLFAENALIAEQEIVHGFFRKAFNLQEADKTNKISHATLSYTSYLLQTCSLAPVEVGIAAVLPCFWVYMDVGMSIADKAENDNPYLRWIETYSGEEFCAGVQRAIDIFDEVGASTTDEMRQLMLQAFYKSAVLEWHFWNDSYNRSTFDDLILL